MLLRIPQLLNPDEVIGLCALAAQGEFVDGRVSAGQPLHGIKHNEQLKLAREQVRYLNETLQRAIERSRTLQFFAWPRRVNTPLISRYTPGMEYGTHIDNPILFSRDGDPLRSDLSMTVFLSEPDSYEGGELELQSPFGLQTVKMAAGDAVIYSTTMRHRVTPITRGTRLAAVTWIQSLVKEADRRQILFDLSEARQLIKEDPKEAADRLQQSFTNLLKMWSEV